jgi:hypothetical protein
LAAATFVADHARAATVAYYRHEGTPGTEVAPIDNSVLDSSGNGNHMRTFANNNLQDNPGFDSSPAYTSAVPFATVPQTGEANTSSLDFEPGGDGDDDNYTFGPGDKPINSFDFRQFTLEASFTADSLAYRAIVGKDGKPVGSSLLAPLQLKLRADTGNLQIEILDGAGVGRDVQSTSPIVLSTPDAPRWYNVAAVNDGDFLALYIDDTGDGIIGNYVFQGATVLSFAPDEGGQDGLIDSTGTFHVGRGFYDNGIGDWWDGMIDEVRISDTALDPSQFLAVPEPSAMGVLGLAGLFAARRRRSTCR